MSLPTDHPPLLKRLAATLLVAQAFFSLVVAERSEPPVARVLFIGNSFTYSNNLPEMLAKLAEAGLQRRVEVRMIAPSGWRLQDHWEREEGLKALHGAKWDYVVLQEQSTLGVDYYLEGRPRVTTDAIFRPYAMKWAAEIRKTDATPVFFLTWARKATPEDQETLNHAYMRAARESRAVVAPVGYAWSQVCKRQPPIELFAADGAHPSPAGSYLAATTIYARLFGKNPLGLPAKIEGIPINLKTAMAESEKTGVLVELSRAEAEAIQAAAWESHQQLEKSGGYLNASPVRTPMPARLSAGSKLAVRQLAGTWSGTMLFYPAGPVRMVLELQHTGSTWSGHVELRYPNKSVTDESFDLQDLTVGEREVSFSNPRSVGVDNQRVSYRGMSPGSGELRGVVEATMTSPHSPVPVQLLGTWQLSRR